MRPTRCVVHGLLALIILIGSTALAAARPADVIRYQRTTVLQVARKLSLTAEQTSEIVSLAREHSRLDSQLTNDLDVLHKQSGSDVEAVLDAWMAGTPAGTETRQKGDDAANEYSRLLSTYNSESSALVQRARELLSAEQDRLIETPERTRQRQEDLRFWQDTQQAAAYVVEQIEIARSLNANEYAAVRVLLAQETAEFIGRSLGYTGDESDALVQPLLSIFDQGRTWSRAEFADRQETLSDDIIEYLGLGDISPPQITGNITETQFALFVTCDQAVSMLSKLNAEATVQMPEGMPILGACDLGTGPAAEHEMTNLVQKARYITLLNDLNVTGSQLSAMAPVSEALVSDYSAARGEFLQVVRENYSALNSLQSVLMEGGEIGRGSVEAVGTIFDAEMAYQQQRTAAAVQQLWRVHEILDRQQNRLINWRPPGPVGPSIPKEERIQMLTRMAANVQDFVGMFDEIRYADPTTYEYYADNMAAEFLQDYIPPRTPDFRHRRDYLVDMQVQARQIPQEQWDEITASQLAVETMRGLRLLPRTGGVGMGVSGGPNAPYTWWSMEEVFSDPQTPEMLRTMLQKRAG